MEHEASMYNAGWSHGKEKLGDKPDFAKGSFYFNPLSDSPGTEEDQAKFPWALPKNLWPSEELPELEKNCKALGTKMQEVIGFLGEQVDRVMATKDSRSRPTMPTSARRFVRPTSARADCCTTSRPRRLLLQFLQRKVKWPRMAGSAGTTIQAS